MTFACWPISCKKRRLGAWCILTHNSNLDILDNGEGACLLHQPELILLLRGRCEHRLGSDDSSDSNPAAMEAQLDPQEEAVALDNLWRRLCVSSGKKPTNSVLKRH